MEINTSEGVNRITILFKMCKSPVTCSSTEFNLALAWMLSTFVKEWEWFSKIILLMSIFENVVYPLKIDGEKNHSVLEEVCEISLRGAALWDRLKLLERN